MRTAAILTALLAITATPALAQHQGHPMPMPAPKPAPAPKPKAPPKPVRKPAPKPAPTPTPPPSAGSEAAAPAPATMPAMGEPMEAPTSEPAESGMVGMAGMDQGVAEEEVGNEPAPPPPTDHAADGVFDPAAMARARAQLQMEHDGGTVSKVMLSLGEYQVRDGENGYRWEGEAWVGGDLNRLVIKLEGEGGEISGVETAEVQALYSRAISPYFDLQAGLRQDLQSGPKRTFATVGFEGLAPYWFETAGALFVSSKGELLGRFEGTYDLRLTQRWILQPRVEVNVSGQEVSELGLGSGVSNVELELRLRYEIKREFAPYVGVSFERKLGGTADYAKALGEDDQTLSLVIGIRAWF